MAVPDLKIKRISLGENKVYLEDGRDIPLDPELKDMIQNPDQTERVRDLIQSQRERQSSVEKIPGGGEAHAFLMSAGNSSLGNLFKNYITRPVVGAYGALQERPGQENQDFLGRTKENIKSARQADERYSQELYDQYPMSSKIGSLFGFGSDVVAASKVPGGAVAEGAALGFSGAPAIYDDPGAALKGTAIGGAIGYGAGKFGQGIKKVASQRAASREYQQAIKNLPVEQRAAREAFRKTQREKLTAASKDLRSGAHKSSLNNNSFIQGTLNLSESAGSAEANSVEKFVTKLEAGIPEKMSSNDVVKVFDALEGRIARASEAEIPLLQSYKQHLVDVLPEGVAHQAVKENIGKQLIERTRVGGGKLGKIIDSRVENIVENMNPSEFYNSLNSGELSNIIRNEVKESYKQFYADNFTGKSSSKAKYLRDVDQRAEDFINKNMDWLSADINSLTNEANDLYQYVQKRVSSRVRNATGSPNPLMDIPPTNELKMPQEPLEPQLGGMARRYEETPFDPMGKLRETGKQSFGLGFLGKMVGLPGSVLGGARALYGAGKVGAEGGMRFLTAPTRVSGLTREVIGKGGLPVIIESIQTTYPSYSNGILLDPMDRQDAVSEIENNPYIPLEKKAILQAKINRGRSLDELKEYEEVT